MTLFELQADLQETNRQLQRIADLLEFAVGLREPARPENLKPVTRDRLSVISDESMLRRDFERAQKEADQNT